MKSSEAYVRSSRATSSLLTGNDFRPRGPFASGHIQTMFSSSRFRRWAQHALRRQLEQKSRLISLDVHNHVRLTGKWSPQSTRSSAKGLAIVFHGWEGHTDSNYVVQIAAHLLTDGWDIFRLNFRDHGKTHHLNRALFHSCMLEEVVAAVKEITRTYGQADKPVTLTGFSLGGNFALRIGLVASAAQLTLDYITAVCPVIDPGTGLDTLENGLWMYAWYFKHKWARSLKRKQRVFPDERYIKPGDLRCNLRELTRILTLRCYAFDSLDSYLDGYSIAGDRLKAMTIPTTILAARNDPVIPVTDFEQLQVPSCVELDIAKHGGHCGFLADWHSRTFTDDYIASRLNRLVRNI